MYVDDSGYVLKIFKSPATGEASARREAAALRLLRKHLLPAPESIGCFKCDGLHGIKMTFADGTALDDEFFDVTGCGTGAGTRLGRLHRQMHSLVVPKCQEIPRADAVFGRAAKRHNLTHLLESADSWHILAHGDFHPSNIVCSPGGDVVLDLSRSFFGPAEADVATTIVRLSSVTPPDDATAFQAMTFRSNIADALRAYLAEYDLLRTSNRPLVEEWVQLVAAETLLTKGGTAAVLSPLINGGGTFPWPSP